MVAEFNVLIIDDKVLEDNETFNLMIVAQSLPEGVISGTPNKTEITITDDDSK